MGLYLNPNADAPDGCAGPVYAFRLTNLEPGIGYRVRVSNVTGGGDYRTRCRSKADSAFYTSELDGLLEEGLGITGAGLFKEETDDMRYLQSLYRQERGDSIDNTAAYIFILPKASVDGVKGDMPLTRPVGYVFASGDTYADGQTIAHELGHGLYSFQHAFDYMGVSQGETDNLMDYGLPQGEHLAVWQWNLISTHKNYTVPFLTDDEDGWKKINGFRVQISEPAGYDGRNFIYDDGGCKNYKALNETEFKSCYQQFDGEYIPLILVARGRTAKFKLKLEHDKTIEDNDLQYDFMVEEADATKGLFFKNNKTTFKMTDLDKKNELEVEFTIIDKEGEDKYPELKNPDIKKYIVVKDYKGNILAKVQYLSLVPKTVKYKLVYVANKNNKVRDFDANGFDKMLNDFHGSLFIKWEKEESDTITTDETFKYMGDDHKNILDIIRVRYYRIKDNATAEFYAKFEAIDKKTAFDRTLKYILRNHIEKRKVFFVTDFSTKKEDKSEVGGSTSWKSGVGALWSAISFPDKYKVCIHEFAHFLHIPDATPISIDHEDSKYYLEYGFDYDNIMYYKTPEDIKKVDDKRWFFYQMKRAYNDWDTYCKEDDN